MGLLVGNMERSMQLFKNAISHISVGAQSEFGHLRITPVYLHEDQPLSGYVGFDDLFDKDLVEASEVSESGVVGRIAVKNLSDSFLCLFDGEALVGAKQNRIVERSLIIPAQSEISVPVNCVERGRWSGLGDRGRFRKSDFAAPQSIRSSKARMMKEGGSQSIQSEVWASVSQIAACYDVRSASEDLGDIFEQAKLDESERVDVSAVDAYLEKVTAYGYIIEGTRSPFIEVFCKPEFSRCYAKKAIRGWVSDTSGEENEKRLVNPTDCLFRLQSCQWKTDETFGVENSWVPADQNNGRLIQSADGHLIHMFMDLTTH